MTLIELQDHFSYFSLKISVAYFFPIIKSCPGDLRKDDITDDLEGTLKVISGTTVHCVSKTRDHVFEDKLN